MYSPHFLNMVISSDPILAFFSMMLSMLIYLPSLIYLSLFYNGILSY